MNGGVAIALSLFGGDARRRRTVCFLGFFDDRRRFRFGFDVDLVGFKILVEFAGLDRFVFYLIEPRIEVRRQRRRRGWRRSSSIRS